jgi:hypothetical protein
VKVKGVERARTSRTSTIARAGWLNLRGAQTVTGLESIDADGIAIDEYDLIPKKAIPVAEAVPLGEECDEASS